MTSALAALLGRRPAVDIRWGLERTRRLLRSVGDPHEKLRSVHIGGTNGKGSTAACVEAVLRTAGLRTGLYTSPHLVGFRERVRIDGAAVDPNLLESCAAELLPLVPREDPTFFETATVLAFLAFRRAECDVIIAEVGLGGRLDATNVLEPAVTVITSVDRDHSNHLGGSLEEIAAEKAGILKPGVPAVVGRLAPGPLKVLEGRARTLDVPVDLLGREMFADHLLVDLGGSTFRYRSPAHLEGLSLRVSLIGAHQASNAALAVRAVELLPGLPTVDVAAGLAAVRWAGRFDFRSTAGGDWVLDVAHNAAAAATLAGMLESLPLRRPIVLLVAILGDKPWREMLDPLLAVASAGVFTVAPSSPPERRWKPRNARDAVRRGHRVEVQEDFGKAVARARELAGDGTVVVTGSAYTVGDTLPIIETSEVECTRDTIRKS